MGPSNTMNRNFTSIQRLKSDLVLLCEKKHENSREVDNRSKGLYFDEFCF